MPTTIIHRLNHGRFPGPGPKAAFRSPLYDCVELPQALKLVLYVPGVEASGVEITTRGPDLFITARKTHLIRPNWQALHLEGAQRDYQLKLRLGASFNYAALRATLNRGALTIIVPKKSATTTTTPTAHRQVA